MPEKLKILIVEPDRLYARLANSILKDSFHVQTTQSPFDALDILKNSKIDILITDYNLPGGTGLKLIQRSKQIAPAIEVIMTGQNIDSAVIDEAMELGAVDFFEKPFDYESVKRALERTRKFLKINQQLTKAESDKTKLSRKLESSFISTDLISVSAEMEEVKRLIRLVAQSSDTSVMITGESGVGKELVARGIHQLSQRNEHLFGAVNMSAISESLFESEFFGHMKGSFTGAISDRSGWFEVADQGTLFLDEIGDMPVNLQIKLLRVLEDRKYIKVGSQQEQSFDTRIIAATNKDINLLKAGKEFRLDLFHRLGAFEIFIPPLRQRKEDIPVLLKHYMILFSGKLRKNITHIENNTLKKLQDYTFPGNVRELKNIVERAVILSDGTTLSDRHFANLTTQFQNQAIPYNLYDLDQIEKMVIIKALEKANYNKSKAAELLNIKWNALHRRLMKHNIDLPD